jgi:hypothetical protein
MGTGMGELPRGYRREGGISVRFSLLIPKNKLVATIQAKKILARRFYCVLAKNRDGRPLGPSPNR